MEDFFSLQTHLPGYLKENWTLVLAALGAVVAVKWMFALGNRYLGVDPNVASPAFLPM